MSASDPSPYRLISLDVDEQSLCIAWEDGHESSYPNVWLRDRCACEACGTSWTGIRFLEPVQIAADLRVSGAQVVSGSELEVEWSPDGHRSRYPLAWLRRHCLSERERKKRRHRPTVWGSELNADAIRLDYDRPFDDEAELFAALESIRDYGFVVLEGGPARCGEAERLASLIGPLEETNFGRVFDLKTSTNATAIGATRYPATLHTDDAYRNMPTGIKSLHCVTPSDPGTGFTVLVDGFKVAQVLAEEAPEVYELLCTVPLWFHRYYDDAHLRAKACVFTRDETGEVVGFRFQDRSLGPLDIELSKFDETYGAIRALMKVLRRESLQVQFRLEAGDAVLFDNQRVLHSRTAFTGPRHLQLCSVNRDTFLSQLRVLGRTHGRDDTDLTLPRGALG